MSIPLHIALVGNPNSGKTSVFNHLTGLDQKVGNYPGVTVEKREGVATDKAGNSINVWDLPGTYSLYASSKDEQIVLEELLGDNPPDEIWVVVDANQLSRGLFLFGQVADLGFPVRLVISMIDVLEKRGTLLDVSSLEKRLGVEISLVNARKHKSVIDLLNNRHTVDFEERNSAVFDIKHAVPSDIWNQVTKRESEATLYKQWHKWVLEKQQITPPETVVAQQIEKVRTAENEWRYSRIDEFLEAAFFPLKQAGSAARMIEEETGKSEKIDRFLTHPIYGYGVFVVLLLLIFQAIFAWATVPMDLIDVFFSSAGEWVEQALPASLFTDLIAKGIIPGIGGIVIFVPQIALLFFFIAILEESGYMSRLVYLMDRIMQMFGLHGKSIVPLISGVACAIPAVMATRTIDNWKDRLITIMVTPFMTCSARLPVYTILIALAVPSQKVLGFFNLQGLALMVLYLLGFIAAIVTAALFSKFSKLESDSSLILEMPDYKMPRWPNVGITIFLKSKSFVVEAGKVIFAISILLWVLSTFGPNNSVEDAQQSLASSQSEWTELQEAEQDQMIQSWQLEHSYAGILGKFIEPAIQPLGYDWKIGIALITSFAAREVFVGTIATIYSVGGDPEDERSIRQRMKQQKRDDGTPVYTLATAVSLLLFYAFAMQCMSTVAVVARETNSWKWPTIQVVFMTVLAYLSAFIAYQTLS